MTIKQTEQTEETTQLPKIEAKKSRRGGVRHKKNPFLPSASINTKVGQKRISNKAGDRLMIVSEETGEIMAPAGFHQIIEVDKTQFVKLFKNGVKAFGNLTNAGAKIFSYLYDEMQKNINKDVIFLSFSEIDQSIEKISPATFFRGMNELINQNFLAESETTNKYFVNPDYLWNGNRLAFIKEFRVNTKPIHKNTDTKTLDLFEEGEKNGE